MKKACLILTASMFALMGMSVLTLSSCSKDEDCPAGMEGKNCDIETRTPMLGTYNATDKETGSGDVFTYSPAITTNATVTIVNISKFSDFYVGSGEIVTSNISKSGNNIAFSIPSQKPDGLYEVSGSGDFNSSTNKITLTYTLKSPSGDIKNYTGTWEK